MRLAWLTLMTVQLCQPQTAINAAVRYDTKHKGSVIICGSAPCVFEDLDRARNLRPNADILGVNYVGEIFPEIRHIWTQHSNHAKNIKERSDVMVHASSNKRSEPVDYVWPDLEWVCGSSGLAGALWARWGLGFDEVIMAGIPLNPEEIMYSEKYPHGAGRTFFFAKPNTIRGWLNHLSMHKENGKTQGIYSMSGETMKSLGEPSALGLQG